MLHLTILKYNNITFRSTKYILYKDKIIFNVYDICYLLLLYHSKVQ